MEDNSSISMEVFNLKKFFTILLISLIATILFACNPSTENSPIVKNSEHKSSKKAYMEINYKEPSSLSIITPKGIYPTIRGAYSWSIYNENTKEYINTSTDTVGPLKLVTLERALPMNVEAENNMQFQFEPNDVIINVWHQVGEVKTYNSISEITERGKFVLEFVAYFEQGTVTYVNAFDLH